MYAALIGAGVSLISSIYGKAKEAKARRRHERFIDEQSKNLDNANLIDKNTNYLDTAEGQSQYQGLKKMLRENNNRVDNSLIKTGGTAESNIAAKESANETLSDATRQMAGMDTQRKLALRGLYENRRGQLDGMKMDQIEGGANAWSTFSSNAAGVMGNAIKMGSEEEGGFFGFLKKKK